MHFLFGLVPEPLLANSEPVPKLPTKEGGIRVLTEPREKAAFIEASRRARQSLSAWVVSACVEKAERQGVPVTEPKKKAASR